MKNFCVVLTNALNEKKKLTKGIDQSCQEHLAVLASERAVQISIRNCLKEIHDSTGT